MNPKHLLFYAAVFSLVSPLAFSMDADLEQGGVAPVTVTVPPKFKSVYAAGLALDGPELTQVLDSIAKSDDQTLLVSNDLNEFLADLNMKYTEVVKVETGIWSLTKAFIGYGNRGRLWNLIDRVTELARKHNNQKATNTEQLRSYLRWLALRSASSAGTEEHTFTVCGQYIDMDTPMDANMIRDFFALANHPKCSFTGKHASMVLSKLLVTTEQNAEFANEVLCSSLTWSALIHSNDSVVWAPTAWFMKPGNYKTDWPRIARVAITKAVEIHRENGPTVKLDFLLGLLPKQALMALDSSVSGGAPGDILALDVMDIDSITLSKILAKNPELCKRLRLKVQMYAESNGRMKALKVLLDTSTPASILEDLEG